MNGGAELRIPPPAKLLASFIIFCVTAELLSLLVFYYQHGWLFYVDPYKPTYALIPETQADQLTKEGLHPYFGPTHKPGIPFDIPGSMLSGTDGQGASAPASVRVPGVTTNNFGFSSRYDYPFIKQNPDQFVIGMFGGSVGGWFCQLGAEHLVEKLQEHPFFRDRALVPICLSHEGYKQPQQLLVLAYFLSIGQQFDLVINIDGFNEVALSPLNDERGSDISMPSPGHIDPLINLVNQSTLTPGKLDSLAGINRSKQQLNRLADRLNRTRLASTNLVLEQLYAMASRRYQAELRRFDELPSIPSRNSLIHVTPRVKERPGPILFADIARNWLDSSMLMKELLAARGVPYFDFLQPNQYYASKPFGTAESELALNDASPFKRGVQDGYPALEKELQSRAVTAAAHVFNAVRIFDRESAPVYADNCCHYNARGNELLAEFIAATVLKSTGAWNP